jgi:hypothetical protein
MEICNVCQKEDCDCIFLEEHKKELIFEYNQQQRKETAEALAEYNNHPHH